MDEVLLRAAREAQAALLERDYEADRTRLTFQHAVRRLHASGATLREMAQALHVSHQRIHQIVEGAEGKLVLKTAHAVVACSFCQRDKNMTDMLVAGPGGIFVCDQCIAASATALAAQASSETVQVVAGTACSFCGRATVSTARPGNAPVGVCQECVTVAQQIVRTQSGTDHRPSEGQT